MQKVLCNDWFLLLWKDKIERKTVNPLSPNPTKWPHLNNSSTNCLSVFDHFVKLALKELRDAGELYVLRNTDMKVHYDLNNCFLVGDNKKELFKLIQRCVEEQSLDDKTVIICFSNS